MLDLVKQQTGELKRKLSTSLARTESEMQEAQRIRFKGTSKNTNFLMQVAHANLRGLNFTQ